MRIVSPNGNRREKVSRGLSVRGSAISPYTLNKRYLRQSTWRPLCVELVRKLDREARSLSGELQRLGIAKEADLLDVRAWTWRRD